MYVPRTREALSCWGYMQAMQDLSVLADEDGHRIMGACPPERTTTLQLIQSFVRYARAHRTELQGNAVVAVVRALREAYPFPAGHCWNTTETISGGVPPAGPACGGVCS